ncbi:DUF2306 domain-containing protein [Echinimonas agarilytica]|uniref:DUF2306 domain-containing protein n=1 Tax=Echinimonas agarilytica TaxID=1215918 RepID=A0AA41W631_9GAMM|nr:DUF2306 domain-containing protein [Echinimonas agarilytica]MCM2679635.1 DUF2306 domain-containing protein [Echinimonas agarilytica]
MIEVLHVFFGFASLVSGFIVLLKRKGNSSHRLLGRVYFICMLALNVTSFGIYKLFGGWGVFHWMAIASLAPLVAGYVAIRYKNLNAHYFFICWSYIGLLCATISEIFVHVPLAVFLQSKVPHLDTALMLSLIGAGLYLLPKYQSRYVRGKRPTPMP